MAGRGSSRRSADADASADAGAHWTLESPLEPPLEATLDSSLDSPRGARIGALGPLSGRPPPHSGCAAHGPSRSLSSPGNTASITNMPEFNAHRAPTQTLRSCGKAGQGKELSRRPTVHLLPRQGHRGFVVLMEIRVSAIVLRARSQSVLCTRPRTQSTNPLPVLQVRACRSRGPRHGGT